MSLERVCSENNVSLLGDLLIALNKRVSLVLALRDVMLRNSDSSDIDYVIGCFDDALFDLRTSCSDLNVWQSCLRSGHDMNVGS